MGKRPHVLAVPFPAQGHVKPLLKLAYQIAGHGIKVTFVNTESTHKRMIASMSEKVNEHSNVVFTSIPDGLEAGDDQNKLPRSMQRVMPGYLTELIEKINSSNIDEQITSVIVYHIPKLIEAGIVDMDGIIRKSDEVISLSPDIPAWKSTELACSFQGDLEVKKIFFEVCSTVQQTAKDVKWLLSNTCYELESAACDLIPKILPFGPLISSDSSKSSADAGSLWLEDTSCLTWLDKQSPGSVIYISFGSIAVLSQHQFNELALGLELSGQPFLWVVRSDQSHGGQADFPLGFLERDSDHGKIVQWAPQEKVLAHPSVACFLTHCGWNSTMERLSMGVPFLCWPFFGDQFHNQSYICDFWKVGLKLNPDENGIRSSHEIRTNIELLLSDDSLKANALKLKTVAQKSVCQGGSSFKNFGSFINFLKC